MATTFNGLTLKILYDGTFLPRWSSAPILDKRQRLGTAEASVTRLGYSVPTLQCRLLIADATAYAALRAENGMSGTLADYDGTRSCVLSVGQAQILPGGEYFVEVEFTAL